MIDRSLPTDAPNTPRILQKLAEYGFVIGAGRLQRIAGMLGSLTSVSGYQYPWLELEAAYDEDRPLELVTYGSLMNVESAAVTIDVGIRTPVMCFGGRRVYEYQMDN